MRKKWEELYKQGINDVELERFSICRINDIPLALFIDTIRGHSNISKRTIYRHYNIYISWHKKNKENS